MVHSGGGLCGIHSSDLQDSLGTRVSDGIPGGCKVLLALISDGASAEAELA